MRYRVAVLLLLILLPLLIVLSVPAAPTPELYAILDIGPPPPGMSTEKHCNEEMSYLPYFIGLARQDREVEKLPSILRLARKDVDPWIKKNLRITDAKERRLLRLSFRAGNRAEQAAIINALLRAYLHSMARKRKLIQDRLKVMENGVARLEKGDLFRTANPKQLRRYKEELAKAPFYIARDQAELARRDQIAVIKWARGGGSRTRSSTGSEH